MLSATRNEDDYYFAEAAWPRDRPAQTVASLATRPPPTAAAGADNRRQSVWRAQTSGGRVSQRGGGGGVGGQLAAVAIESQSQAQQRRRRQSGPAPTGTSASIAAPPRRSFVTASGAASAKLLLLLPLLVLLAGCLWPAPLLVNGVKLQPEGRDKFYWSGEQFVITCQNNNNIKNVKIRWLGPNGVYITEDRSQRVHAESSGPHGHRLVVMNATANSDDGQYKCTIGSTDDRTPRESIDFTLKIYQAASFKDTAQHLALPTGQSGTLSCRVEFDQNVLSPTVSWMRNSIPIDMLNDSTLQTIEYDQARQQSQLQISSVAREHAGTYTCRALAVTPHLSKISEHQIELDTLYAPQFDSGEQVVWVESGQSLASRSAAAAAGHTPSGQEAHKAEHLNRNLFGPNAARNRHKERQHYGQQLSASANTTLQDKIVRVELRCSCEANPAASILWSSTQSLGYVLAKGEPPHILEEPLVETRGHNSTSILIVGYNLDSSWPNRRDSYVCSASNKQGKAQKRFTIEQGDPPPAFHVGAQKRYDPKTSQFEFTLLGPNLGQPQPAQHEIVPPVDSFRIRAESSASEPRANHLRRHLDASVQWNLPAAASAAAADRYAAAPELQGAKNFTVSLNKLPTGNLRLFLEAHNAVGWSPNATYLGDFDIVSGAARLATPSLLMQLALSFAVSFLIIRRTLHSAR